VKHDTKNPFVASSPGLHRTIDDAASYYEVSRVYRKNKKCRNYDKRKDGTGLKERDTAPGESIS
jgi:hypothetical protein